MSDAARLIVALQRLCTTLERSETNAPDVALRLALRLIEHPALQPFREDPMRELDGERPSLDALDAALRHRWKRQASSPDRIGCIWGALYLPAEARAVAVRLRAFVCMGEPDMIALRPLAHEVLLSANAALAAARIESGRSDGLVILDIESEGIDDALLGAIVGDSFGLPLALAFLSALRGEPLPSDLGATGAVGRDGGNRLGAVGWIEKKRAALSERDVRLLAPPQVSTMEQAWHYACGANIVGDLEEPLTPLLGRENEVAKLTTLLSSENRLVTITGPGGSGKTRLALHLLRRIPERFPGGIWVLSLVDIKKKESLRDRFAGLLSISANDLPIRFSGRRTLLVLDNAETLEGATKAVGDLLRLIPELTCLVTSRNVLGLRGEQRFDLDGLPLAEGVNLFFQRAREVDIGFDGDRDLVELIVRRLDSLPLAIELAASRTRMISLPDLYSRLERALDFLSTRSQDIPERHRTIKATIEWSYKLLENADQAVLDSLSVFAGGFTEEAAAVVTGNSNILDVLIYLEEHSFLRRDRQRYHLLSLIRDFAYERLVETGREFEIADRHAEYFADYLQEQREEAQRIGPSVPIIFLNRELDNLRGTFLWLYLRGGNRSLDFVAGMSQFLMISGLDCELESWTRSVLPMIDKNIELELSVRVILPLSRLLRQRHEILEAEKLSDLLILLSENAPMSVWRSAVLVNLSFILVVRGDFIGALNASSEALKIHEKSKNLLGIIQTINNRGLVYQRSGYIREARENFEKALHMSTIPEATYDKIAILENLIDLDIEEGDFLNALKHALDQCELRRELRDISGMAITYCLMGKALCLAGELYEARTLFSAALAIRKIHWRSDMPQIKREWDELEKVLGVDREPIRWASEDDLLFWEPPIPAMLLRPIEKEFSG